MMSFRQTLLCAWLAVCALPAAAAESEHWIPAWGASPSPPLAPEQMAAAKLVFANQTLREIVHTSVASHALRLRFSNAYGKTGVRIGAAHVALRSRDTGIVEASDRVLSFGGRPQAIIPPDALLLSDPVEFAVPPDSDLAISIFLPDATTGAGIHYAAQQTSYIATGDATGSLAIAGATKIASWVFVSGIDVLAPLMSVSVAAFGDSITDGAHSTTDANMRWPDVLAARLLARKDRPGISVLNAGIGGNRILHDAATNIRFGVSALARFDRDVLAQPGIQYVIVLEGVNDLGHPGSSAPESETVTAEDLIAGFKQLIERAHENGKRIFGATILPFEGAAYYTPAKEAKRKAINEWIRTSGAFDAVVDFDKAMRDPDNPGRMLADYDSGDHLHPGDAGYQAMGAWIDLSLFQ